MRQKRLNNIENQGRAVFLMELVENELPNFDAVLKGYGVALNRALTVEGDTSRYWQSPAWLFLIWKAMTLQVL